MHTYEVLKRPLQTEKMTYLRDLRQYAFEVDDRANKTQVKEAVEAIFKVDVVAVNTISVPSKTRRVGKTLGQTQPWRKAVVTLRAGQRIEVFEGV